MDWAGVAAFVTSVGTLVSASAAYRRAGQARSESHETRELVDHQIAPKIDEVHDVIVNGSSQLPADTPRSAPPKVGT